ncbi:MAG: NotI family restriction endonuclease [Providencia heimbachae]|nr:NotI family restriction endonuclease [Providencia heimbachae]
MMAVSIAEYLGQRTDVEEVIIPVAKDTEAQCPFMDRTCDKVTKKNHPVCSVRKPDSTIWIVCEHRLCSTRQKKDVRVKGRIQKVDNILVEHQIDILRKVAKLIYQDPKLHDSEIGVKREVNIPLPDSGNSYHADYVMRNFSGRGKIDEVLLEMQGGGETSSTGAITRHIAVWSALVSPTNEFLRQRVTASPIETNAWRRQQEQFLVKGNVVDQTGGKIVFAVGTLLYDYLHKRFKNANLRDLKAHNWTLCILAFKEDTDQEPKPGPIPLVIDKTKTLFTNYSTFVRFLTDQGAPRPELFEGEFLCLDNNTITIDPSLEFTDLQE